MPRKLGRSTAEAQSTAPPSILVGSEVTQGLTSYPGWSRVQTWFESQGWSSFPFQQETWSRYLAGEDLLVNAPTGHGKTLAAFIGPVLQWINNNSETFNRPKNSSPAKRNARCVGEHLQILWITPLRALANDTAEGLSRVCRELRLPWSVELRTGDSSSTQKSRQRKLLPSVLVTTPESASVLLSYPQTAELARNLLAVVVDEWHELLGTKRGVMTELVMARLRQWNPGLGTVGLSATLGNMDQALECLVGTGSHTDSPRPSGLVLAGGQKVTEILTVLPDAMERFPWVGHLGTKLLPQVVELVEKAQTTLLFTNVRSQAEIWYRSLCEARPDWVDEDQIGIHHGSLDRDYREQVERRLALGNIRVVVCTSSLDLGVDFAPVDQVIQVGSPKGVARLLQRAGRSGHQPGRVSRVWCVPTHAFELVEYAAARDGVRQGWIESRVPVRCPLDLLAQHMITIALGDGFQSQAMFREVRSTAAFCDLSPAEWEWCLAFIERGGDALSAYPQYCRAQPDEEGIWRVPSKTVARFHRLSIGTITSDASIMIRLKGVGNLGTVEESFIARLIPGSRFVFAGRVLEFIGLKDMVAEVRLSASSQGLVPRWSGSRMPLSSELAAAVRHRLEQARQGQFEGPEMEKVSPILGVQARWSTIPLEDELMLEAIATRDGHHYFFYPFEGRLVHEGLGALAAFRIGRMLPRTLTVMVNDYGVELFCDQELPLAEDFWRTMFSPDHLVSDLLDCLNSGELTRRHFREVARVAGLLFGGYPGQPKSSRQIQSSSGLLFDVFQRFDPGNLLLEQTRREVLDRQLEVQRMAEVLKRMSTMKLTVQLPKALTPLAFPIWASRVEAQISTENWSDRVKRMALVLDDSADGDAEAAQSAAEAALPAESWTTAYGLEAASKRRQSQKDNSPRRRRRGAGFR
jgi:ATP-dependent Lhr-like helicase